MKLNNMSFVMMVVFIFIMMGATLSVFPNNVFGENLIEYSRTKDGTVYYYDLHSVKKSSGKVQVWVTVKYGEDDRTRIKIITILKENKQCNECEKMSFSMSLIEIYCREDLFNFITSIDYNKDGNVIWTDKTSPENKHIIPGSRIEGLKDIICN